MISRNQEPIIQEVVVFSPFCTIWCFCDILGDSFISFFYLTGYEFVPRTILSKLSLNDASKSKNCPRQTIFTGETVCGDQSHDKPAFQRPPSQFSQVSQHVLWVSASSICSTLQENVILQWMTREQKYFSAGNLHWITNALGTSLIYLDLPLLQVVGLGYTQVILYVKIWPALIRIV